MEVDKIELRKKEQEVKVADDLLSEVLLKYNKLSSELEDKKRLILKQAKIEAKRNSSKCLSPNENTISQIKEANANKEKALKIREEFSKRANTY